MQQHAAPRVEALGTTVGDQVRAPSVISSFHAVAQELILNALDADASLVEVKVNSKLLSIAVLDNGRGMGFADLARCGEWHASSKTASGGSFGFRGEALAAIAFLSELEVTSKEAHGDTLRKMPRGRATLTSAVVHSRPSPSSSSSSTPAPIPAPNNAPCIQKISDDIFGSRGRSHPSGTLTIARNIFHNLPVRRKVSAKNTNPCPIPFPSPHCISEP